MVIEAVFEDMGVKEQVFRDARRGDEARRHPREQHLDARRDQIAAFTRRPQDVIGMHFFSPANVMKLLEVVRGEKTAKDVLATAIRGLAAAGASTTSTYC